MGSCFASDRLTMILKAIKGLLKNEDLLIKSKDMQQNVIRSILEYSKFLNQDHVDIDTIFDKRFDFDTYEKIDRLQKENDSLRNEIKTLKSRIKMAENSHLTDQAVIKELLDIFDYREVRRLKTELSHVQSEKNSLMSENMTLKKRLSDCIMPGMSFSTKG